MGKKPKNRQPPALVSKETALIGEPPGDNLDNSLSKSGPEAHRDGVSRRNFLTVGSSLAAVCGIGALVGSVRFAFPETADEVPVRYPLGTPADFRMRTVTWIREKEIFVFRDERGWGVFSSKCTHLGCTVRRTAEGFTCPCHGAQYDSMGNVISGPARRPLPWFALWQETDGRIWVDVSRTVAPGTSALLKTEADREQERS